MLTGSVIIVEDTNEDDVLVRHKKEKKDLQNEITHMKHSVPKTDKKGKKEMQAAIAKLENDMQQRHCQELEKFRNLNIEKDVASVVNGENFDNLAIKEDEKINQKPVQNETRTTRAQKRRDKKETEAKGRQQALEQSATETYSSNRAVEKRTFKPILSKRRLKLVEISADGDCMYNAVAHQLHLKNERYTAQQLRDIASKTMKTHKDEFLPFLHDAETDNDELMNDEQFENYCNKLANTTTWGGHVELKALSMGLRRPIEVLQANGSPIIVGEELKQNSTDNALVITFHRHAYHLGEHYNSTGSLVGEEESESDKE